MASTKSTSILGQETGSVLLWVLIAATIVPAIIFTLPIFFQQMITAEKTAAVQSSAQMVRDSLQSLVDNDATWAQIVSKHPALGCLTVNGADCGPILNTPGGVAVRLYDGDGNMLSDITPNAGFDITGAPCNTFDPALGSDTCIFQYQLNVKCNGPCAPTSGIGPAIVASSPSLIITSTFLYSPKDRARLRELKLDSTNYTINYVRGAKANTISNVCNSLQGVFNQQTMTCTAPGSRPASFDCRAIAGPTGFFAGLKSDGTPDCRPDPKVNTGCPGGQGVVGIDSRGFIICGPF
jgi:hypothetical protein